MDIVEYTDKEIRKNLALLEIHLKQAKFSDDYFCEECINKHILILEGLSEEGISTCDNCMERYELLLNFLIQIKNKNYQELGVEIAQKVRQIRKNFVPCDEETGMRDRDEINKKIEELEEEEKLAKDKNLKERLEYGIYLLKWMLRGKRCHDI